MAATPGKLLALDTNVLFDLAAKLDFAHDFRETFLSKGYSLVVPPTAVQELVNFMDVAIAPKAALAELALTSMLQWGIKPFDLISVERGITESFYNRLVRKRLLPEGEKHDGFILAETAIVEIPVLVTSDGDLLNMDGALLKITFDEASLAHVTPCHPKRLLRAARG